MQNKLLYHKKGLGDHWDMKVRVFKEQSGEEEIHIEIFDPHIERNGGAGRVSGLTFDQAQDMCKAINDYIEHQYFSA